ncbi:class I SAM-dependent methyltransferase [Chloroflexi bacterium CFX6]|nr:class I SAM-dependent methyltransferase [Chloroflexi bacterium CFX6]
MTALERNTILADLRKSQTVALGNCPVCGGGIWEYFGGRLHFDIRVEYWICKNCALVAQSPRLEEEYLSQFYARFYRFLYEGESQTTEAEFEFQIKRGRNLLSIFLELSGEKSLGNLLDFGSSAGGLLQAAVKEMGASSAVGIELDHDYKQFSQDMGFTVFENLFNLYKAGKPSFDVITMSHVLEHVSDFRKLLQDVHALLRQDGYLCIEVPHTSGGACFEITHLWGFNETSLERLLRSAGFQILGMRTHGYPRAPEKDNLYLVVVAQKHIPLKSQSMRHSSPFRERMRRYLSNRPAVSYWEYQRYLMRNTIKQILGLSKGKLVAHSWMPSKLRRMD